MSYSGSGIHVHSKPDGPAGAGTGFCPPGFPGNGGWAGREAGFTSFHITKDPDGVPGVASVWVDPVLAWNMMVDGFGHWHKGPETEKKREKCYRCSCEGGSAWYPGSFWPGLFCFRPDCAGLTGASWASSAWCGLQCLHGEQPPSCWEQPRLCSSLELLMGQLQPRRPQIPPCLEHHRSPRSRMQQQRGLQQMRLEDLGVLGVQGVRVVLLDPSRQKMDALRLFWPLKCNCTSKQRVFGKEAVLLSDSGPSLQTLVKLFWFGVFSIKTVRGAAIAGLKPSYCNQMLLLAAMEVDDIFITNHHG